MEEKVFIVIPAFNESRHIKKVLENVKSKGYKNIILVDDGSNDDTYKTAVEVKGLTLLRHMINLGKGAALKTGCEYAVNSGAKIIVVMDSDGQHKPDDIPRFLEYLKNNDIVFGYRKIDKNMPFVLRLGNNFINFMTKMLYNIDLYDSQSGFRAFTSKAYKKIIWKSRGYSVESEMIANAGKRDLKYKQIPIETIYSDKYKGTTVIDGIKIVTNMLLWRLTR